MGTQKLKCLKAISQKVFLNHPVVQLQTSKLVFSKTLHRSTNTHHSNGQHRRSIPWDKLTHEVSMNSPTRLPAVRGTNDIVNLTQPLLYNVRSVVLRL